MQEQADSKCDGCPLPCGVAGMQACINCRREVMDSKSRVAKRIQRRRLARPECSPERCAEYLATVTDEKMRRHLAAMAWWRFSAEQKLDASPVLAMLRGCKAVDIPPSGADYLHAALRELSRLTWEQISSWFGFSNLYEMAVLFARDEDGEVPSSCHGCPLLKMGCTDYNTNKAASCWFRDDEMLRHAAHQLSTGAWNAPLSDFREDMQ